MQITNPDTLLLERVYQPLSNRLEYHTGVNCFTAALIAWTLAGVSRMIFVELTGATTIASSATNGLAWGLGVGVLIVLGRRVLSAHGTMNPWKQMWWARIAALAAILYRIAIHAPIALDITLAILLGALIVLTMTSIYFASCDPMPPGWRPPAKTRFAGAHV
jgi:chromate transport protein ChrA